MKRLSMVGMAGALALFALLTHSAGARTSNLMEQVSASGSAVSGSEKFSPSYNVTEYTIGAKTTLSGTAIGSGLTPEGKPFVFNTAPASVDVVPLLSMAKVIVYFRLAGVEYKHYSEFEKRQDGTYIRWAMRETSKTGSTLTPFVRLTGTFSYQSRAF